MAGPCWTRKAAVAGSSQATTDASASSRCRRWPARPPPVGAAPAARPARAASRSAPPRVTRSLRTNQPSTVERGCTNRPLGQLASIPASASTLMARHSSAVKRRSGEPEQRTSSRRPGLHAPAPPRPDSREEQSAGPAQRPPGWPPARVGAGDATTRPPGRSRPASHRSSEAQARSARAHPGRARPLAARRSPPCQAQAGRRRPPAPGRGHAVAGSGTAAWPSTTAPGGSGQARAWPAPRPAERTPTGGQLVDVVEDQDQIAAQLKPGRAWPSAGRRGKPSAGAGFSASGPSGAASAVPSSSGRFGRRRRSVNQPT